MAYEGEYETVEDIEEESDVEEEEEEEIAPVRKRREKKWKVRPSRKCRKRALKGN